MDQSGGSWLDPFEDPRSRGADDSLNTQDLFAEAVDDPWVTGEALSQILMFETSMQFESTQCLRCSALSFTYGAMRFCSFGCPENMLPAVPSA